MRHVPRAHAREAGSSTHAVAGDAHIVGMTPQEAMEAYRRCIRGEDYDEE
jgi:hypothetical protein